MTRAPWIAAAFALAVACKKDPPPPPPPAPAAAASAAVDVVSSASPGVWDAAAPPVVAEGELDGDALRARNLARLAADKGPVVVLAGGTARELGERICEAAVPKRP